MTTYTPEEIERIFNKNRFLENEVERLKKELEAEQINSKIDLKGMDTELETAYRRVEELENELRGQNPINSPEEIFEFFRKINDPHANNALRNFLVHNFHSENGKIER